MPRKTDAGKPRVLLETARLRLRDFTSDDGELLYALDSDPEVMRYIADGRTSTREQVDVTLRRIIERNAELEVLGLWAAELKESGEFIGWFALKVLPATDEVELGYRLLRRRWGRGYATEGARALVTYGFESAGLKRIVAIADPRNAASRHVLEKAGLRFERRVPFTSPTDGVERLVDFLTVAAPFDRGEQRLGR